MRVKISLRSYNWLEGYSIFNGEGKINVLVARLLTVLLLEIPSWLVWK